MMISPETCRIYVWQQNVDTAVLCKSLKNDYKKGINDRDREKRNRKC